MDPRFLRREDVPRSSSNLYALCIDCLEGNLYWCQLAFDDRRPFAAAAAVHNAFGFGGRWDDRRDHDGIPHD